MFAFANMNAAGAAGGINAQQLFQMDSQQQAMQQSMAQQSSQAPVQPAAAQAGSWTCECGTVNTGNFCPNCGKAKPMPASWTCSCGTVNTGNFCSNCGKPRN